MHWVEKFGGGRPETGGRRLEAGGRRLETGDWRLEARCEKSGERSLTGCQVGVCEYRWTEASCKVSVQRSSGFCVFQTGGSQPDALV